MIRKASSEDVSRMAEIIVYSNRLNYFPIFKDEEYSFKIFTVENVSKDFLNDKDFMDNAYVYDDKGIIKGFVVVIKNRILKLYVDSFFTNNSIGSELIEYAINNLDANYLTVLKKNEKAKRFYERHGFINSGEWMYEEDTTEILEVYRRKWKKI